MFLLTWPLVISTQDVGNKKIYISLLGATESIKLLLAFLDILLNKEIQVN